MAKQKLSDRVKELEAQLEDARQEILYLYDKTKNDIKEDVTEWGWGDTFIAAASLLAGVLVTSLVWWLS